MVTAVGQPADKVVFVITNKYQYGAKITIIVNVSLSVQCKA